METKTIGDQSRGGHPDRSTPCSTDLWLCWGLGFHIRALSAPVVRGADCLGNCISHGHVSSHSRCSGPNKHHCFHASQRASGNSNRLSRNPETGCVRSSRRFRVRLLLVAAGPPRHSRAFVRFSSTPTGSSSDFFPAPAVVLLCSFICSSRSRSRPFRRFGTWNECDRLPRCTAGVEGDQWI